MFFFTETYKIRRTTCLFTIIFEACYLLKLGLNVEAEIQILNWIYPLLPCLKTPKKAISWQKLIIIHLFKVPIKIPWFCHNGLSFCLSHFIYFLYNFSTFNISSKRFTSKSVSLHNSFAIKIPHTFFSQFAPIFCTYLALIGLFPYNPLKYQMNKLLELDGRQLKLKFTACVAAI
jgi:hypothetical protein